MVTNGRSPTFQDIMDWAGNDNCMFQELACKRDDVRSLGKYHGWLLKTDHHAEGDSLDVRHVHEATSRKEQATHAHTE